MKWRKRGKEKKWEKRGKGKEMKWRKRGKEKGKNGGKRGKKRGKKGGEKEKGEAEERPAVVLRDTNRTGRPPRSRWCPSGAERFGCGNGAVRVGAEAPLRAAQRG